MVQRDLEETVDFTRLGVDVDVEVSRGCGETWNGLDVGC